MLASLRAWGCDGRGVVVVLQRGGSRPWAAIVGLVWSGGDRRKSVVMRRCRSAEVEMGWSGCRCDDGVVGLQR